MSAHQSLAVALGKHSYEILVGDGLLAAAGQHIAPFLKNQRVMVVTDENVAGLYLGALEQALDDKAIAHEAFVLPPGEATKGFSHLETLLNRLLQAKVERSTTLIALGGGVIGDLAGFAASVLLRGIDFVQIPTTLLAQVDSSVGGKTAIDTPQGKNLVGSFHQPRLVLCDTGVLSSLPVRERLAGYAEVVKYGLINDTDFFTWLEAHGSRMMAGDLDALSHAVVTCCNAKATIVAADEREAGQRALLNLGHTFGHALEAEIGFGGELLHGEAVAIGMVQAFELSTRLGLCPEEDTARVRRHLAAVGLPTGLGAMNAERSNTPAPSTRNLLEHMGRDKKVADGRVTFVLARAIGEAFLTRDVQMSDVEAVLDNSLSA